MARTVFVNPSRRRNKKRKHGRRRRRNVSMPAAQRSNPTRARRRNSGIAPFVSNPLIMSNPRRRRRRSNPLSSLTFSNILTKGLTYGGGAAIAVGSNALVLNRIENVWGRNVARFGAGILSAVLLPSELGAATAGGMFYPMLQEFATMLLGKSVVTGTEADMDVLAADLEDVMNELEADEDLEDVDELDADEDDILG
jgi:hypothetical protein